MKPKILVIYTNKPIIKQIQVYLKDDFEIMVTPDRPTGIKMLKENPDIQLVVTNIGTTGKGLEAYSEMKAIKKGIKVIFANIDKSNVEKFDEIIEGEKKTNPDIIFQLDILSSFDSDSLKKKINFLLAFQI